MWDYDGFSKLQLALVAKGVVDLSGEVDDRMAKYVREALLRLKAEGSPDIEVRITSNGGTVEYGLDIYDMLRLYEGKTRAVVYGTAQSMAAVFLQACTTRCAAASATILIHHIVRNQVSLDDLRNARRMAAIRKEAEASQRRLYAILSKRTGRTIAQIRSTCAKDKDMTAAEALEFGLIDEIL